MKNKQSFNEYQIRWEIEYFLKEYFEGDKQKIESWLNTHNGNFGCLPSLVLEKRPEKLLLWMYRTWEENYSYIDWEKDIPKELKNKVDSLWRKGSLYFYLTKSSYLNDERPIKYLKEKRVDELFNILNLIEENKKVGGYV